MPPQLFDGIPNQLNYVGAAECHRTDRTASSSHAARLHANGWVISRDIDIWRCENNPGSASHKNDHHALIYDEARQICTDTKAFALLAFGHANCSGGGKLSHEIHRIQQACEMRSGQSTRFVQRFINLWNSRIYLSMHPCTLLVMNEDLGQSRIDVAFAF